MTVMQYCINTLEDQNRRPTGCLRVDGLADPTPLFPNIKVCRFISFDGHNPIHSKIGIASRLESEFEYLILLSPHKKQGTDESIVWLTVKRPQGKRILNSQRFLGNTFIGKDCIGINASSCGGYPTAQERMACEA